MGDGHYSEEQSVLAVAIFNDTVLNGTNVYINAILLMFNLTLKFNDTY